MAIEIGQRRGWSFDFADEEDQDTLLAWMHNRFVKYADKTVRNAIKLDRDWDNEEGERAGATLARLLTAPLDSDPQMRLQLHEERQDITSEIQRLPRRKIKGSGSFGPSPRGNPGRFCLTEPQNSLREEGPAPFGRARRGPGFAGEPALSRLWQYGSALR